MHISEVVEQFLQELLSDRMCFIFSAANKNTDQNFNPSKNVVSMYVINAVHLHFRPTSVCFVVQIQGCL